MTSLILAILFGILAILNAFFLFIGNFPSIIGVLLFGWLALRYYYRYTDSQDQNN